MKVMSLAMPDCHDSSRSFMLSIMHYAKSIFIEIPFCIGNSNAKRELRIECLKVIHAATSCVAASHATAFTGVLTSVWTCATTSSTAAAYTGSRACSRAESHTAIHAAIITSAHFFSCVSLCKIRRAGQNHSSHERQYVLDRLLEEGSTRLRLVVLLVILFHDDLRI